MFEELEIETDAEPELHELAALLGRLAAAEVSRRFAASLRTIVFPHTLPVLFVRIEQFHMIFLKGGKVRGVEGFLLTALFDGVVEDGTNFYDLFAITIHYYKAIIYC